MGTVLKRKKKNHEVGIRYKYCSYTYSRIIGSLHIPSSFSTPHRSLKILVYKMFPGVPMCLNRVRLQCGHCCGFGYNCRMVQSLAWKLPHVVGAAKKKKKFSQHTYIQYLTHIMFLLIFPSLFLLCMWTFMCTHTPLYLSLAPRPWFKCSSSCSQAFVIVSQGLMLPVQSIVALVHPPTCCQNLLS